MKKDQLSLLYGSFLKVASVGTNTATSLGNLRSLKPTPGKINLLKRMITGTARGFDPKVSVLDGLTTPKKQ